MKVTDEMVTDAMNTYLNISPEGVNTAGLRAVLEQALTLAQPAPGVGGDWDPWIGDFAVAEIGPVWAIRWIGRHSIDKVASMHGLRTGDRLVPECDFLSLRGDYNRLLATCDHLQSLIDSPKDGDLIVGGMAYDD